MNQPSDVDKKLVQSLNLRRVPKLKQFRYLTKVFSSFEKKVFFGAAVAAVAALIVLTVNFYQTRFIPTPTTGGTYTEALIGAPQYINPILSQTNDVDSDISRLVFSGLFKYDQALQLVPDLVERFTVGEDEKTFTFILREGVLWHDGNPLTADDVVFTVKSIQDPEFRSPLLVSLRGVTATAVDDRTVQFILPEAFPSFLEVLTFGVLPEHIWGEIPTVNANLTEYNLKPIGSGPWQFKSISKDRLGNIKSLTLAANSDFYGQQPYLQELIFKFYPDFQTAVAALKNKSVEGISFLPKDLKSQLQGVKNIQTYSLALPQYTAIFFNQEKNEALADKAVRKALALAIDKPALLAEALQLEGEIIDTPMLPGITVTEDQRHAFDSNQANVLLDDADWKRISPAEYLELTATSTAAATTTAESDQAAATDSVPVEIPPTPDPADLPNEFYRVSNGEILTITLTTVDQPENTKTANLIAKFWRQIGFEVKIEIISSTKISREVIKPRQYQALLFGIIVGSNPDPYPFWHSSQVQDPGLNLALFSNRKADTLLEDARKTADETERTSLYEQFQDLLIAEVPAIFLYNPTYTYVIDQQIKGFQIDRIIIPADRFNNLSDWFTKTKRRFSGNTLNQIY